MLSVQKSYFRKYSALIFSLLFLLMALIYQFDEISFMRPQSVHRWRQCDCLSFAQNYYNKDISFFEPQINYLAGDGSGKTVSDCPLIYYSVAQLWKIFGYHEFIYRLLVLLMCFVGLLALMKTIEGILKDSFSAIFISLLMYTSTILVYYSNNFLMNVPSFSFALLGIYFFYRFYSSNKLSFLYISLFMYLIGGLLKIPALTSFIAIFGLFVIEMFGWVKLKGNNRLFTEPVKSVIPFVVVGIIIYAWYHYAYEYNRTYNGGVFLIGILPIWELSIDRITYIISHVWDALFDSYHSPFVQYLAVLMLIGIFIFHKKQNRVLFLSTSFLFIGFALFILLWFDVFDNHGYYLINQLIFMIFIYITFFYFLQKRFKQFYYSIYFRFAMVILLISNVFFCAKNINQRYFGSFNEDYITNMSALETISPFLDSLGVSFEEKVLFMNDESFNISLYLMNRRGYTAKKQETKERVIERLKKVNYFITNDTSLLKFDYIKSSLNKKVGVYKNIYIYSLSTGVF